MDYTTFEKGGSKMSENNYSNGETKDNKADYEDVNYQGSQFTPNNTAVGSSPDMYYDGRQTRNIQPENRMLGTNPRNYRSRENNQYNPNNRPDFNDSVYQTNYNENPRNYYRGDDRMNYSQYNPNNRPGFNNSVYQANYNENPRNYYRGDDRMNYPMYYSTNYPNGYRMEDDYGYRSSYPKYYDDYDCDCDCYELGRPYYGGGRPYRGPRAGAWYPNMRCCDQYYNYGTMPNYGMMPNSWWNQRMITDFINRPRVNNFFRGVGIATVGLILAPSVARTLRPIVAKAVQGVMNTSEEFRGVFADAKEDIEDIFAEAKWEGNNNERYNSGENENHNK